MTSPPPHERGASGAVPPCWCGEADAPRDDHEQNCPVFITEPTATDCCERCRQSPVADEASGLCWRCSEHNDERVVL